MTAGLISSLGLFLALKREMQVHDLRYKARIEEMMARLTEAEHLPHLLSEVVAPEPTMFVPAPLRAGLNLNKRVHALRMLRRGEDVSHVAAALGVPRREVELMVRVQDIGKARAAAASANSAD